MIQGQSYTIGIRFNPEYDTARIEDMELCIGNTVVAKHTDFILKDGEYRLEFTSKQTRSFCTGERELTLHLQDKFLGVVKPVIAKINIDQSYSKKTSEAINTGINLLIEATVKEEVSVENVRLAEILKGERGEKGEQGERGEKGEKMTFADLTEEEKAELRAKIMSVPILPNNPAPDIWYAIQCRE